VKEYQVACHFRRSATTPNPGSGGSVLTHGKSIRNALHFGTSFELQREHGILCCQYAVHPRLSAVTTDAAPYARLYQTEIMQRYPRPSVRSCITSGVILAICAGNPSLGLLRRLTQLRRRATGHLIFLGLNISRPERSADCCRLLATKRTVAIIEMELACVGE
jgi:hypothetical protein